MASFFVDLLPALRLRQLPYAKKKRKKVQRISRGDGETREPD